MSEAKSYRTLLVIDDNPLNSVWTQVYRSADFDRVTAERDALQQLLNVADEQVSEVTEQRLQLATCAEQIEEQQQAIEALEQRHRAEFEACQAAERRVEVLEGFLSSAIKRFGLADKQPDLRYAILELLNPTAEGALKPAEGGGDE